MKKIVLCVLGLMCIQSIFAADFAKLRIKIQGATSDNRYFLCVGTVGCVSIKAGDKGTLYPMQAGNIDYIYTTSVAAMRVYPQSLPSSCNVEVKNDQTVTVTGRIVQRSNEDVHIEHLNCHVS